MFFGQFVFAPYGDSGSFDVTGWSGNILRVEIDPVLPPICLTESWVSLKSMISDILGFSMEAMGTPWGPMGVPMASMENPRMSEIMDFNENHYSVRQKIGVPGSKSIRNAFPLHPVTSKPPESPYGAKYFFLAENPVFQFFGLEIPYRTRVGA